MATTPGLTVTIDCPGCGHPIDITYTPVPEQQPGTLTLRPTYQHTCPTEPT